MENQDSVAKLFKYFSGNCTENEQLEIENWLNQNEKNKEVYESIKVIWMNSKDNKKDWMVKNAWDKISIRTGITGSDEQGLSRSNKKNKRTQIFSHFFKAAVIIFMIVGIYYVINISGQKSPETAKTENELIIKEITTKRGEIRKVKLGDGTLVTINAGSVLKIPLMVSHDKRLVKLEGEAYFDVAKDKTKPFVVLTNSSRIKVLGTRFNLSARKNNNEVVVAVTEGKVAFKSRNKKFKKEVVINKGEISKIRNGGIPENPIQFKVNNLIAWTKNELVFMNASFKEVINRIENKYDVNIGVSNSKILSMNLSASFKDETLKTILEEISISLNLGYKYKNDDTIIFF